MKVCSFSVLLCVTLKAMQNLAKTNSPYMPKKVISLHVLVNEIISSVSEKTIRHNSSIVNDIPAGLELVSNTDMVASVVSNLLFTLATYAENSCIRITTKVFNDVILLQLKDQNSVNTYTIANSLQSSQPIAEKIGGYLGVTSQRKNETTIVFSFPNIRAAA